MKQLYFLVLLVFLSPLLRSQNNVPPSKRPFSVFYGQKFLQKGNFGDQLNTLDHLRLQGPLRVAGFELGLRRIYGPGNSRIFYWLFGITVILPAKIQVNDSIASKMWGLQGGALPIRKNFRNKKQTAGVSVGVGFNTGGLSLKSGSVRLRNTYFSPKVNLQPWILLKPIRIGFTCEYEYDVSRSDWKPRRNTPNAPVTVSRLAQTGMSLYLNIGVNFL